MSGDVQRHFLRSYCFWINPEVLAGTLQQINYHEKHDNIRNELCHKQHTHMRTSK